MNFENANLYYEKATIKQQNTNLNTPLKLMIH